jgi:hypothetical protein
MSMILKKKKQGLSYYDYLGCYAVSFYLLIKNIEAQAQMLSFFKRTSTASEICRYELLLLITSGYLVAYKAALRAITTTLAFKTAHNGKSKF